MDACDALLEASAEDHRQETASVLCCLALSCCVAPAAAGGSGGGAAASLLDDGLGGLEALLGPPAAAAASPSNGASSGPSLALTAGFKLMPGVFQERWRNLAPVEQYAEALNMATVAAMAANGHKDFCAHMGQANVSTMASGGQPPAYK